MRMLFLVMATLICGGARPLVAQTQACTTTDGTSQASWRRIPIPAHVHPDTASPAIRESRDQYWSKIVPSYKKAENAPPIPTGGATIPETAPPTPAQLAFLAKAPLPKYPDRFWVEAAFEYADVFETAAESIYTEAHLRIIRSIGKAIGNVPQNGAVIDLDSMGGCLLAPSGEVHQFWTGRFEIQPGHKYLMEIYWEKSGEFYGLGRVLADVTSGIAQPVSPEAMYLSKAGAWPYTGLSESAAIKHLESDLASAKYSRILDGSP